jgi:hypothetical protein
MQEINGTHTNCSLRGTLSSLSLCTLAAAEPSSAAAATTAVVFMMDRAGNGGVYMNQGLTNSDEGKGGCVNDRLDGGLLF